MITDIQCRTYAAECERLEEARGISSRRATVLMAMAHSWNMLAGQKERYAAIVAEEGRVRKHRGRYAASDTG